MMVAISPVYVKLVHRFVSNVGPKSLAKISEDSGIAVTELEVFAVTKELEPEKVMRIWGLVFPNHTFIEASAVMDALDLGN